jgi:hypothetical protein
MSWFSHKEPEPPEPEPENYGFDDPHVNVSGRGGYHDEGSALPTACGLDGPCEEPGEPRSHWEPESAPYEFPGGLHGHGKGSR